MLAGKDATLVVMGGVMLSFLLAMLYLILVRHTKRQKQLQQQDNKHDQDAFGLEEEFTFHIADSTRYPKYSFLVK